MIRIITPSTMQEFLHAPPQPVISNDESTFEAVYAEPAYAHYELERRRKDVKLKESVRIHLGTDARELVRRMIIPRAVLFRQVATPTHEILCFLRMAKLIELKPLLFEYHGDKFVSAGNTYKRALGKMPLYQYTGTDGRDMVKYHTVFDFNSAVGKRLSDIHTSEDERLINFHHRLLARIGKINPKTYCFDATSWLGRNGGLAPHYYESFLTLFVRDGILFESFENTPHVRKFFRETVLPAFQAVEARFGVRPLIVRLLPHNDDTRLFWDSYPKKVERFLTR